MADLRAVQGGAAPSQRSTDRLFDLGAEGAVLSNVLLDPALLDEVRGILLPAHFYSEANRRIFEAALQVADAGGAIDVVSVATALRESGHLAQAGGMPYLTSVLDAAPAVAPSHLRTHAKTVRGLHVRREVAALAKMTSIRCESDPAGVEVVLADLRARVDDLSALAAASEQSSRVDSLVVRTLAAVTSASKSEGRGARPSGFDRLDRITGGLHAELFVLGARPGMGKTSLATAIGVHCARAGEGVYVASLETDDVQLMTRMVCSHAGVDMSRARVGALTTAEWARFDAAAKAIAALPIWVDHTSAMSVAELWTKCRRAGLQLAREGRRLGLVVVDYVQLLRAPRAGMKREEVVGENARALKALSTELDLTVLALAQLNREVDKRTDRRPQLSDLRESGELEQAARTVALMYREDYYKRKQVGYRATGLVELDVAKQNNGPTGLVRLRFDATCLRFENLTEGSDPGPDPRVCAGCRFRRIGADGRCTACGWTDPKEDP